MLNLLGRFVSKRSGLVYNGVCTPQWTAKEFDSLAEEGFQKNVFAFRAISLIAKGISSISVSVQNENKTDNIELTNLINNPNITMSKSDFFEQIVDYLMISGNAFVWINENNQLQCLRPDRVHVVPNKNHTAVDHYIYTVDDEKYRIKKYDLLHLKLFNPLNDWYGISPLQVASQAIDQYNEMSKHNLAILQNGGRPSGCFMIKDGKELTDDQLASLQNDIRRTCSGSSQAGRVLLLQGGIEWREMGLSPKDLDFEGGRNLTVREIAQAFGVPPVLLGIECNASFNSYKEARLNFWEDTVLPLANFIKDGLTMWLSNCFQKKIYLVLDLDSVPALIERREILWNKVSNADFLTVDEKREILGYPKLKKSTKKTTNEKDKERK